MTGWSGHDQRLTPRQREILERIARGHTNTQIATDLGIGFETVKMHVSHILRELGVSSREEAAAWWRATHHPLTRVRAVIALGLSAKTWAIAGVAAAALAGFAVLAIAVALATGGDGPADEPLLASAQSTETPAATTTAAGGSSPTAVPGSATPTAPPPGMGYEAAAALFDFELISVEGDALHTRVVVEVSGHGHDLWELFRETGYPVFWLTDSTGERQQVQGGASPSSDRWVLEGWAIPETPGTLTIEARPVREYVVPAVPADAPDPVWAHWEVPWNGYTSTTRTIALPAPDSAIFGDGTAVVDEILQSDTITRIRWHVEGFASPQDVPEIHWRYIVFDAVTGNPLMAHGGGTGDGNARGGVIEFSNPPGDVVLLLRGATDLKNALMECENVRTVANSGLACDDPPPPPGWDNLSEMRNHNGPVAEFFIDLP